MPIQVIMPQLGESVTEGTISKWLVAEGEQVNEYDPLVEVNTDKVDTEIPSPASGFLLQVVVEEGTIVLVGTNLAWIGELGEEIPDEGVIPDAVSENDQGYLMLKSDPVIWAMLNAIKELKAENEELKQRIEALEGQW